jgi:hypothetical protein
VRPITTGTLPITGCHVLPFLENVRIVALLASQPEVVTTTSCRASAHGKASAELSCA